MLFREPNLLAVLVFLSFSESFDLAKLAIEAFNRSAAERLSVCGRSGVKSSFGSCLNFLRFTSLTERLACRFYVLTVDIFAC